MFKIFNFASTLLTALLLSGCWGLPVPRGDTPEEFTEGKNTIRSMLGMTNEEVIDTVGQPTWITLKDSKTYYIYEWSSHTAYILMGLYVPFPWVFTHEGENEKHCILLEFGSDKRLESFKVDTVGTGFFIIGANTQDLSNCHRAFGMNEDLSVTLRWMKNKGIGTYCLDADTGDADAQTHIGDLYYSGAYGLKKNLTQAYVWYSLSAKGGNNRAAEQLDKITNEFSPLKLNEAQIQLEAWEPGHCEIDLLEAFSRRNE